MIKIGDKYKLINYGVFKEGIIVEVADIHDSTGIEDSYTVIDEYGNGYLVSKKNLGEIEKFPNLSHKEIDGVGYGKNKIILLVDGKELVFSANRKGDLLINGVAKKDYMELSDED